MILGRSKVERMCAIAKREKRNFLAFEKILDDDPLSALPRDLRKLCRSRLPLVEAHRHRDALARREPVGLDHGRRALFAHESFGGRSIGETRIGRGWNSVAAAKILGKGLGAFEPCGRLARTEGLDPSAVK